MEGSGSYLSQSISTGLTTIRQAPQRCSDCETSDVQIGIDLGQLLLHIFIQVNPNDVGGWMASNSTAHRGVRGSVIFATRLWITSIRDQVNNMRGYNGLHVSVTVRLLVRYGIASRSFTEVAVHLS